MRCRNLGDRQCLPRQVKIGFSVKIQLVPDHLEDGVPGSAFAGDLVLWDVRLAGVAAVVGLNMSRSSTVEEIGVSSSRDVSCLESLDDVLWVDL